MKNLNLTNNYLTEYWTYFFQINQIEELYNNIPFYPLIIFVLFHICIYKITINYQNGKFNNIISIIKALYSESFLPFFLIYICAIILVGLIELYFNYLKSVILVINNCDINEPTKYFMDSNTTLAPISGIVQGGPLTPISVIVQGGPIPVTMTSTNGVSYLIYPTSALQIPLDTSDFQTFGESLEKRVNWIIEMKRYNNQTVNVTISDLRINKFTHEHNMLVEASQNCPRVSDNQEFSLTQRLEKQMSNRTIFWSQNHQPYSSYLDGIKSYRRY